MVWAPELVFQFRRFSLAESNWLREPALPVT